MSVTLKAPSESTKNQTGDFDRFVEFARRVVSVPHSQIKAQLDAEKAGKRKSKRASRASGVATKKS